LATAAAPVLPEKVHEVEALSSTWMGVARAEPPNSASAKARVEVVYCIVQYVWYERMTELKVFVIMRRIEQREKVYTYMHYT